MNLIPPFLRAAIKLPFAFSRKNRNQKLVKPAFNHSFTTLSKTYLTAIFLLLTVKLLAQNTTEVSSFLKRTNFKVGYFGNVSSNNGLNIGAEYLWKEKVRIRERKKGRKTTKFQLLLNGSIGFSTNFATSTQNGIFAYSGFTLRGVNTKSRNLFIELNPLGFYRSVLHKTYKVTGDKVTKVLLPGRSYYAPSVAIGIGRFRKGIKKSGWYLNLQFTLLTNYNAGFLPITSLHFGRKFNFCSK